jgi:hypothetical protein
VLRDIAKDLIKKKAKEGLRNLPKKKKPAKKPAKKATAKQPDRNKQPDAEGLAGPRDVVFGTSAALAPGVPNVQNPALLNQLRQVAKDPYKGRTAGDVVSATLRSLA